ncbi:hypothetical protein CFC21_107787, partial [Triticum aestivum]
WPAAAAAAALAPPRHRRRWKTKTSYGRFPPPPASALLPSPRLRRLQAMARRRHRPPIPPRLPRPPPETSGPRPRHGIQRGAVLQVQPQLSRSHPAQAFLFPRHPRPLHGADWLPPWTRPLLRPGAALWNPATGCRCSVAVPPMFDDKEIVVWNGAVLCAAGDEGHVHGDCHSSPILIGIHRDNNRAFASVYSSEAGTWGELISTAAIRNMYDLNRPGTLVGDSVYWVFDDHEDGILRFDLDRHSLFNIEMPDLRYYRRPNSFKILRADDGSVGLAILEYQKFQMWERKVGSDGVAGWMLQKTFQMNTILGLGPMGGGDNLMLGYDEDDHEIYVRTDIGVCIIQLETMQFRNLGKDNFTTTEYYPYRSFYTA